MAGLSVSAGGRGLPAWLSEGVSESSWEESAVENEAGIALRFEDNPNQPLLTCSYCGKQHRSRSYPLALEWFHSHLCSTAYILERAA